jgi:hypothetical protein
MRPGERGRAIPPHSGQPEGRQIPRPQQAGQTRAEFHLKAEFQTADRGNEAH